ncbi:hypothetical protein D3C81_386900 [compost metagenome]
MNLLNWLGVATVAATKQTNSNEIMVHSKFFSPTADGRALAQTKMEQETSLNADGLEETSTSLTANTIPAVWGPIGEPNRKTAPDVREGSQVAIYQVSGQNQYYWTTYGFNADTHRLETVIWGFNANPGLSKDTPFSVDDYTMFKVSTHEGLVQLRTSQANGEKSSFDIMVNGRDGRVDIRGSEGSILSVNDPEHSFTYTNKDGSIIGVDKDVMLLYTKKSINVQAEKSVSVLTEIFNLQCKAIRVKADTAEVAIGKTKWEGDIDLTGNVTQTGDYDQEGDFNQDGTTFSTGIVQGWMGIKSATTDLDTMVVTGVEGGRDTSGPRLPVPQPPVGG